MNHELSIPISFSVGLIGGPSNKAFLITSPSRDGVRTINNHVGRAIAYVDECGMVKMVSGRGLVRREVDMNDGADHLWGTLVMLKVVKATNYAAIYGAADLSSVCLNQRGKTYTPAGTVSGDVGTINSPRYRTPTSSAT